MEPFGRNSRVFRQFAVASVWFISFVIVSLKEGTSFDVDSILIFAEANSLRIMMWIWYFSVALATCLTCILARVLFLKLFGIEWAGKLLAVLLHTGLASIISQLTFDFDLKAPNTPLDEILLNVISGYIFYEALCLKLVHFLNKAKALALLATQIIIWTFLEAKRGADVLLLIIFLVASITPSRILPSFGSSYFRKSAAFRYSVWLSFAFSAYQCISAVELIVDLWLTTPRSQLEHFELALHASLLALTFGASLFMGSSLKRNRRTSNKRKDDHVAHRYDGQFNIPTKRNIEDVYD